MGEISTIPSHGSMAARVYHITTTSDPILTQGFFWWAPMALAALFPPPLATTPALPALPLSGRMAGCSLFVGFYYGLMRIKYLVRFIWISKEIWYWKVFSIFFYSRENDLQDGFLHSKLDHPRMHPLVVSEVETAIHRSET